MGIVSSSNSESIIWRNTAFPSSAPEVGFTGVHLLPIESKFAGVAKLPHGWGKHVGPVDAVVEQLRSMTPQQIRDRLALHR